MNMSTERLYQVIRAPHVSEKAARGADASGQHVFRVAPDATKPEIKSAVERLFKVDVRDVLPLGNATRMESMSQVLELADAVTLHVPDEPSTQGMLGAREIAQMKEGAFLINNARGSPARSRRGTSAGRRWTCSRRSRPRPTSPSRARSRACPT